MTSALFEEYLQWQAKPKIELVNGQLIIGKNLSGSRLLLNQILRGWGALSAVALAPEQLWWQALSLAFEAPFSVPDLSAIDASTLRNWVSEITFTPDVEKITRRSRKYSNIRETLYMAFFGLRPIQIVF